jgi:predicted PurR-regulated permease PerM
VFGGFLSFGFLGLFIGPTLLAVAFELLAAWRRGRPAEVFSSSRGAPIDGAA